MTVPQRLLEQGGSELQRQLLVAGLTERPSTQSRARAAAALGIATVVATQASSVGATTALAVAAKWLAGGVLVGTVVVNSAFAIIAALPSSAKPVTIAAHQDLGPRQHPERSGVGVALTLPSVPKPESGGLPGLTSATRPSLLSSRARLPALSESAIMSRQSTPLTTVSVSATIRARSASDDGLTQQLACIDRARQALARGLLGAALTEARTYQQAFPHGFFGEEAQLIEAEALVRTGNATGAVTIADRLLCGNPSGPHGPRLRSLVRATGREPRCGGDPALESGTLPEEKPIDGDAGAHLITR